MVALAVILSDLLFGMMLGCVFAVVAHGLNLIWGVVKVVNIAHGEFIQHLDSDDLLLPRKFELQVAGLLANRDCGAS